jgi:hypothetical protein
LNPTTGFESQVSFDLNRDHAHKRISVGKAPKAKQIQIKNATRNRNCILKFQDFLQVQAGADFSTAHIVENLGNLASQIPAMDDSVDKSVLKQEFAGLKAFWELDSHRLLNHLWASEANQGLWLCQIDIAQARKTGGHSTHRRVSHYGDKKASRGIVTGQGR